MKLIMEERVLEWPIAGMNEDEFFAFCAANPEQPMERDKHGNILIMAPVHFESGERESFAHGELYVWNRAAQLGSVFSPSTGFTLPNGAVRSPDAAWISNERLGNLPKGELKKFAHICPDFVIEIRSESDQVNVLKLKMAEYMENGSKLGFLIDPYNATAYVYRADKTIEMVEDFTQNLSGENILPGFQLSLALFITK